jgi:hypothetical protein
MSLQEAGMHTTILISEKCAFEGTTRFEDGLRLPLGISVNFPSFAAGILTEVSSAQHQGLSTRVGSFQAVPVGVLCMPAWRAWSCWSWI